MIGGTRERKMEEGMVGDTHLYGGCGGRTPHAPPKKQK